LAQQQICLNTTKPEILIYIYVGFLYYMEVTVSQLKDQRVNAVWENGNFSDNR